MIPPILYHYTSLEAFWSIISTGKIRATHYRHLGRDTQEVRFGVTKLLAAVKQHKIDDSHRDYRDYLVWFVEQFKREKLQVYVLSLTEKEDSEYHWREYAPCGVAMGFCHERVRKGFPIDITRRVRGAKVDNPIRPDPANRFMRCQYIHTLDLPVLVAKRFFTPNSYPAMFGKPMVKPMFDSLLAVSIYQTICSVKRKRFVDDMECRCVHLDPDQHEYPVKTDERGRPFIEMQFNPLEFVKEVWIGPHACNRACETIIASFAEKGHLCCDVKNSFIAHGDAGGTEIQ